MSLRINTNTDALSSYNRLTTNASAASQSMQRLSSGFRINSAADDTAGLSISERMRGQIRGLAQATSNIGDAQSLVQTAEGALSSVHGMLQRVRELAVQYQNGTLSTTDKASIASEVTQLQSEISRIGEQTKFNGVALLSSSTAITFQVGADDGQTIAIAGFSLGSKVATFSLGSATAIASIDAAINDISAQRGVYGATSNRLQYALDATTSYHENLVAAESRIRDADMAKESVALSKNQVLVQAGTAMLAQANQSGQNVLSLLR